MVRERDRLSGAELEDRLHGDGLHDGGRGGRCPSEEMSFQERFSLGLGMIPGSM